MQTNSTENNLPNHAGSIPVARFPSVGPDSVGPSVVKSEQIATESGHWYLPDGTPFYTIIGKTTGKDRPVTIRDARKVDAVPSVTTITNILASRALEQYKLRQLFDALIDAKWEESEDRDSLFRRILALSKGHAERRADEGHKLHGAIEQFLRGELISDKTWLPHIANLVRTLTQYGINLHDGAPEKSFAHPLGYGGKCDWHEKPESYNDEVADGPINHGGLLLDFKTKDKLEIGVKKYGYSEQAMQLSAYREGLGMSYARCINIFVGCEDRQVLIHEWPEDDLKSAWEKFYLLLRYWQIDKNYFPGNESN